ncbi:MAG TPA: FtsX-like permease family protein [Gammaproteobacteria bacterium]|nr:FtsX-like permease family protein [Gammaproteobacteria bacterium]
MPALAMALKALAREWRSGELAVLFAALVVAVAALTAVGFFTDRVAQAVELQASEVLAADLLLRSAEEIAPDYEAQARRRGLRTAATLGLTSVVGIGERTALAHVKAAGDGYPLRGRLQVADRPFGPARHTDSIPPPGEAWPVLRLMALLGAGIGDTLRVGARELAITRVLEYRPDQSLRFSDLTPTVLINIADVPATGLVQPGSRVTHARLFAGDPGDVAAFRAFLENRLRDGERLVDAGESGTQLASAIDRAGRFLNLAALVGVLLAAVAIGMAARRYALRHLDAVALMKCLGARQAFILRVSLAELLLLALVAGLAGSVLGFLAQFGLAWLLSGMLDRALPPPGPAPLVIGLATATLLLAGFALPTFLELRRVSPARILNRALAPIRLRNAWVAAAGAAAVAAMLAWVVRDAALFGYVIGGTLATLAALAVGGWLLVRALDGLRGRAGVTWRYGLANIARRGRDSIVQIVGFGLGIMVLLLLAFVRTDLLDAWQATLPERAPNHFLINIQPGEVDTVRAVLAAHGLDEPELAPLVRARLTHIGGVTVGDLEFPREDGRGFAEREANLSWREQLQEDNEILSGEWWSDGEAAEVSAEEDFAADLGLELGDTVTYDVAGESLTARVTSLRSVQWDSFRPNFFMVFSPEALRGYPATWVGSVHVPQGSRDFAVELAERLPSVSVIDMEALLVQVRAIMDNASLAVQYVFLFTLLAGLTVLLAAVQSTRDERRYESAVLRTLGASRRVILAGVGTEFFALGLLAGLLAAVGASAIGWLLATRVFELDYSLDPLVWVAGVLAGTLVVGLSGLLATRAAVVAPPVNTLRRS